MVKYIVVWGGQSACEASYADAIKAIQNALESGAYIGDICVYQVTGTYIPGIALTKQEN